MHKPKLTARFSLVSLCSLALIALVVFFFPYIAKGAAVAITYLSDHTVLISTPVKNVTQFEFGGYHSCALTSDKQVYCAGYNAYGALGNAATVDQSTPVLYKLPAGKTAASISILYLHTCALTTDHFIYCAGYNAYGGLGNNTVAPQSTPVLFQLPAGKTATAVSDGVYFTCALTADSLVYCSGENTSGQLGNGSTVASSIPVLFQLPAGKTAAALPSEAANQACVLTSDQLVYCAGLNSNGQLGDGTTVSRSTAVQFQLPAGKKASTSIRIESSHICVLTTDQLIYCAGGNGAGQLGNGTLVNSSTPVLFQMPSGKSAVGLSVGQTNHVCALTNDQFVYCAGDNASGDLGDGTTTTRPTPVQFLLPAGKKAAAVSAGGHHICVLTLDQLVYCSGDNTYGQLSDGTVSNRLTPVLFQLPAGQIAASVVASSFHTCVVTNTQQTYCAGFNTYGQLGNGATAPTQTTAVKFTLP